MAPPRKLPDKSVLRQLRAQDWTLKEIADMYGVTEAAVWKALERAGFTEAKETYHDIVPWNIHPMHRSTAIVQRFRALMRQNRGEILNPTEKHLLDTWLQAMKDGDVVLDYHPEAPPNAASRKGGFFYVPREPQDEGFIRMPKPHGEGLRVPKKASAPEPEVVTAAERILTGATLN
jgi:hypothetical protein